MLFSDDPQLQYAVECERDLEAYIRKLEFEGRLQAHNPTLRNLGLLSWKAWSNYWGVNDGTMDEHIKFAIDCHRDPSIIQSLMEDSSDLFV